MMFSFAITAALTSARVCGGTSGTNEGAARPGLNGMVFMVISYVDRWFRDGVTGRSVHGGTETAGVDFREGTGGNLRPKLPPVISRSTEMPIQISPLEDIRVIPLAEAPQVRLEVRLGDAPLAPNGMCSELSALDQA